MKRDEIGPALRRELEEFFADDFRLLESLPGRDLESWRMRSRSQGMG